MDDHAPGADSPMRLLLINPNTSAHITERLPRSARAAMAAGDQLTSLLPPYRQRVAQIGITARVVAYEAPEMAQAFESERDGVDPAVLAALVEAGERLRKEGAESSVLAGAVLCGYAEAIPARCHVPVFDGVACAMGQVRNLLNTNQHLEPRDV